MMIRLIYACQYWCHWQIHASRHIIHGIVVAVASIHEIQQFGHTNVIVGTANGLNDQRKFILYYFLWMLGGHRLLYSHQLSTGLFAMCSRIQRSNIENCCQIRIQCVEMCSICVCGCAVHRSCHFSTWIFPNRRESGILSISLEMWRNNYLWQWIHCELYKNK